MTIWLTSDEHHGHDNIIKYCGRPFRNSDAMSTAIIERHNRLVGPNDVVYHLGDFSLKGPEHMHFFNRIMRKYKPVKERHLILGNHDRLSPFQYVDLGFTSVHTSLRFDNLGGREHVLMNHDPAVFQMGCGADLGLCGHIHALWQRMRFVYNVGVDVHHFFPVELYSINEGD
jgi:calcineurin-like phosphoesterase family protein